MASGSGAGDGFDGTDVVQTHMTNSRLTDPEVLEWRYPVLLESFADQAAAAAAPAAGAAATAASAGIRFREPMTVTTLTGHRRVPPYGLAGGEPGRAGPALGRAPGRHG